jgi:flagellar biosynthesis regulator FlbT
MMGTKRSKVPKGFPKQVIIRGETWDIHYVDGIVHKKDKCLGITWFDKYLIEINTQATRPVMRDTLLHEFRHVYFARTLIRITPKMEEVFCDLFASAVRDLVENNPLDWLKRK